MSSPNLRREHLDEAQRDGGYPGSRRPASRKRDGSRSPRLAAPIIRLAMTARDT